MIYIADNFCFFYFWYLKIGMVIMITCMPCGLNTIVFPKMIGEDCKTGARLALISHFFSVVTLPLWLSLI